MNRWFKALTLFIYTFLITSAYSVTVNRLTITVDNKYIQTYRGQIGRWLQPEGNSLQTLATKYGTTTQEILSINDNSISGREYIFVPFNDETYQNLLKQGFGRRIVQVDPRRYIWPAETPRYTSRFGSRFSEMHSGLDISAPMSTPVVAADDGEVIGSAWMGGLGKAVIILHEDGKKTVYGHNNNLLLKVGERVNRGQIIAYSGSTGRSTGPHIHFEVRFQDVGMNPEDFLPYGYHQSEIIVHEDSNGIAVKEALPDIRASSALPIRARSF